MVSSGKCAVAHSKGLALDLAFLHMLNSRITYAPVRIPLVDHTANSAQVQLPWLDHRACLCASGSGLLAVLPAVTALT